MSLFFYREACLARDMGGGHPERPLAGLALRYGDDCWLCARIGEAADTLCQGRVVAGPEGGYEVAAPGRGAASFCRAPMG